jgi:NAD(P)-dependent dehydrogenase (short-subunit alcohol dehydrogenase family)
MNHKIYLKDKTILITGASSGIGYECASLFASFGANTILVGSNESSLNNVKSQLLGTGHSSIVCDLKNISEIEEIIATSLGNQRIDGFVHSAGIEMTRPLRAIKPENFVDVLNINSVSAFMISKILSKKKHLNSTGSSFILISSIMSVVGQPGKTGYCASKGALVSGSKALALELAPKKIRVNSISPGLVETKMSLQLLSQLNPEASQKVISSHPLGTGKALDIAYLSAFLMSDMSRWITGTNIIIDGGYSAV